MLLRDIQKKTVLLSVQSKRIAMNMQQYDSTESGYLVDGFEGIGITFTDVELLWQTNHHLLARAKRYGRWWMLKALKRDVAEQTIYQQMLRKELEMLMHLQHPYIVQTVGLERVEGLGMCIVMEYVDGVRLDEWLKLPQSKECRYKLLIQLLEAMEYVHAAGMVHRDLKPGNILVTRNGANIKLIDFGLADNDHMAILKQPTGTADYIAPEQATMTIPDIRNDIYSLGKVIGLLLPERSFKSVVCRCLKPIDKRYQNVGQLLKAIKSRKQQKRYIATTLAFIVIVCLMIALGVQTRELQTQKQQQTRLHTAIEVGIDKVDRAFQQAGLTERLDTCTNFVFISDYFYAHNLDGSNAANAYLDSIRSSFSQIEMSEISIAIHLRVGELQKLWMDKLTELTTKMLE